ncbi:MAG TPA: outer membrane protein transport protein, partial [Polyangia bacterium]
YRPWKRVRLELDMDYEAWSMQKEFTIHPNGVYISGVPGIGNYYLNPLTLQRGMQDTFAVNLGAEATIIKKRMGGMILHFHSRVMLSACSELNCAPEDPGFDSLTQVDTDSAFTPSGVIGAIFAFDKIRAGINLQLPFFVRSSGTVATRLPTDPFFANSAVNGNAISVDFNLPLTLRGGLEYRPWRRVRLELDMDYEAWSMQKELKITPHNVYISGVPGVGNYYLAPLSLVRGMNDTFGLNLGAEIVTLDRTMGGMVLRAGYALETSATPDETASVLTPDALRNVISIGGGLILGPVRLDLGYSHVFFADRNVTNSRSLQLNPIQPSLAVPVGNGRYTVSADVLTAGLEARW